MDLVNLARLQPNAQVDHLRGLFHTDILERSQILQRPIPTRSIWHIYNSPLQQVVAK